jgi:hypothetical protein
VQKLIKEVELQKVHKMQKLNAACVTKKLSRKMVSCQVNVSENMAPLEHTEFVKNVGGQSLQKKEQTMIALVA